LQKAINHKCLGATFNQIFVIYGSGPNLVYIALQCNKILYFLFEFHYDGLGHWISLKNLKKNLKWFCAVRDQGPSTL